MTKFAGFEQQNRTMSAGELTFQNTDKLMQAGFQRMVLCNRLQEITAFRFHLLGALALSDVTREKQTGGFAYPSDGAERKFHVKRSTIFSPMLGLERYAGLGCLQQTIEDLRGVQCGGLHGQKFFRAESILINGRLIHCQKEQRVQIKNEGGLRVTLKQK